MLLCAHDSWEVHDPVLTAFDPPGSHRYALMEILLHQALFLVEAVPANRPGDEPAPWSRYLLTGFDDVRQFLASNRLKDYAVSILLPRHANADYEYMVSTVTEAYEAKDPTGQRALLFICANGRRFWEASAGVASEDALTDRVLIFQKGKPCRLRYDDPAGC